jgi:hypothetical protein
MRAFQVKDTIEQHDHLPENQRVLQKPFAAATLAQRVRAALDAPPPRRRPLDPAFVGRLGASRYNQRLA